MNGRNNVKFAYGPDFKSYSMRLKMAFSKQLLRTLPGMQMRQPASFPFVDRRNGVQWS